ncbi:MAG: hypothetical protein UV67_C0031G0008 [Parcubacteria group bacterium GW2011_GWC1_43_12]|nr:MAG: hypothetical protein UV67_C0031G0008 [Parcubacteria group bacterium GW2011_GWC1_43_12]
MPKFDGSRPWGMGPGTGWGNGPCCGGAGWRKGGAGMGLRRFYNKKEEKEDIEGEIKVMEEDLQALRERLSEISQGK